MSSSVSMILFGLPSLPSNISIYVKGANNMTGVYYTNILVIVIYNILHSQKS